MSERSHDLKIEYLPPQALRPRPDNANRHSKSQIAKIARSIQRFGFVNPALISNEKEIIAGAGRVAAAKKLGLKLIPTVRLSSLTSAEELAYNLADNRLAEFSRINRKLLAVQLEELKSLEFDDIEITGFSRSDIESIHREAPAGKRNSKTARKDGPGKRAAPREGDLWILGPHRFLVGDAEAAADCRRIIDRRKADMASTGPVSDFPARRYRYPDFARATWDRSHEKFGALLATFLRLAEQASLLGARVSVVLDSQQKAQCHETAIEDRNA